MGLFESCLVNNVDRSAAGNPEEADRKRQSEFDDLPAQFYQMYRMGPLLGVGSTSKVYSLKHSQRLKTGKAPPLVCKYIDKKKLVLDPCFDLIIRQLRSEASILKSLAHKNIVSLYDFIETKSSIYLILGFIPGEELFNYVVDRGALSEQGAKSVMNGVFSAMEFLHSRGIVHRDVKAENLLVSVGITGVFDVKLIDFGFSKVLGFDLTRTYMGTDG
jgi:serine/threonine protein kinase